MAIGNAGMKRHAFQLGENKTTITSRNLAGLLSLKSRVAHFSVLGQDAAVGRPALVHGDLILVKWVWVKNGYPRCNPSKWNPRLKPAIPWWINF